MTTEGVTVAACQPVFLAAAGGRRLPPRQAGGGLVNLEGVAEEACGSVSA